jgi:CO/xanthine dehydrogenase FAD-binding subunit
VLVDLNRLGELEGIEVTEDGALSIGALTRQRTLERDSRIARACPLVAEAMPYVGHVAIRNRGTLGGSLAHADPAAELPAVVTALGAEIHVRGPAGSRTVTAAELFVMPLVTSLEPDELVVSVSIPAPAPRTGHAWCELAERHGDFALAGAAAAVSLDEHGACREARLALAGVGPVPVDAREAAAALAGSEPAGEALDEAAELAARSCDPASDGHASARYRRRLVRVLARRALGAATARARGEAGGA